MILDAVDEVGRGHPGTYAPGEAVVDVVTSSEMQCRLVVGKSREGVKEVERSFSRDPVADRHERDAAAPSEIRGSCRARRRQVTAWRHHHDPIDRKPVSSSSELLAQRLAGGDEELAPPVERAVERGLHGAAWS